MVQERHVTTVSNEPTAAPRATRIDETVRRQPSGAELARRVIVFIFGILQVLLLVRIVLLLLDASRGNALVRFIYDFSGVFVAPFENVLHTNAVTAGASILDVAAIVALIGWSLLEAILVAGVAMARREA
jgi:YGGT family protein